MIEIKISEKQYNKIEELRYEPSLKYAYVMNNILYDKYNVKADTVFFAYKDSQHFYLVFEGEKISNNKIPLSVNILDEKLKEKK